MTTTRRDYRLWQRRNRLRQRRSPFWYGLAVVGVFDGRGYGQPLAPMFLPPQERLAALKRREAELEAAKVTETSERPRKERKARKVTAMGGGK